MAADIQLIIEVLQKGKPIDEAAREISQLGSTSSKQAPRVSAFTKALQRMGLVAAPTAKQLNAAGIAVNQFGMQASRGQTKIKRFGSVGLQQVGYQVGDFAVQIQGGTNALVALGQQGSQLLGILGPMGAIAGAALAIWTAVARVKQETSSTGLVMEKVWVDVKKAIDPIKPVIDGIMKALSTVGDAFIGFANLVLNNTQRAIAYLGGLVTVIGIKLVAAWIASGRAALTVFRIIRLGLLSTGIGIFAVAIGEIAYQFAKGGDAIAATSVWIGKLFSALGDLASATGTRIGKGIMAWVRTARADMYAFEAFWYEQFINLLTWLESSWVGTLIRIMKGAVAGIKQTFLEVSSAITDPFIDGINNAIAKLNDFGKTGFAQAVGKLAVKDSFFDLITREGGIEPLKPSGDDGFDRGQAIFDAVKAAYKEDLSVPILGNIDEIRAAIKVANDMEAAFRSEIIAGGVEIEGATAAQKKALDELFALFSGGASDIQIQDWFGAIEDGAEDSNGAIDKLKDKLTELQERNQDVVDAMSKGFSGFFNSLVDGTKSIKDAFKDMARSILSQLWDILVVQQLVGSFNAGTGAGSGIAGFIGGLITGGAAPTSSPRPQPRPLADGGIVNGPTLFPMANGMGLMGEAGPEAVMPLKRGKDGKLGVYGSGGGDTIVINQSFNFSANGDETVKRIIAQAAPSIASLTKSEILKDRRRGGVMKATFG